MLQLKFSSANMRAKECAILKSLPHIPLDPHTLHVTQEMADQIFDYLVEHYPARMEKISIYEKGYTDANTIMAYAEASQTIIQEISRTIKTPDSELGYIELTFELVRRCRAALGFNLPQVLGKPLAPSIEGPYPKRLADKPIQESTLSAGFTQSQIDSWGGEFYMNNKKFCYENAESYRREVASGFFRKGTIIHEFFFQKVSAIRNGNSSPFYTVAAIEFSDRIRITCEI